LTLQVDRRELLAQVATMLGGALSAGAVAGILSGVTAGDAQAADAAFFTPAELATASGLAEQIMPRTDTPGALDAGVPAFIDRMMSGYYNDRDRQTLRTGLARVEQDAKKAHGKSFAALTPADQIALMKVYDREAYDQAHSNAGRGQGPHFFRLMKELTTLGFFTSKIGATQFLRYNPNPGPYQGDVPYAQVGRVSLT
jgi:gluconate 2-dehydrogenase gamma chain